MEVLEEEALVKTEYTQEQLNNIITSSYCGRQTFSVSEKDKYAQVTTSSVITGCGLVQMTGLNHIVKHSTPEYWKKVATEIGKKYGVNTILAATGESWPDVINEIEKYGFKKVAQHINTVHGTQYVQYLYLYIVNDKWKPKGGWGICTEETKVEA